MVIGTAKGVPNRVREFRTARGWTLEELEAASGLTNGFISEIERGLKIPTIRSCQALARALGVSVEELFPNGTME